MMQDFENRHGLTFPSLNDVDGSLFARYGIPAQPAWVFVYPDGATEQVFGALEPEQLANFLSGLSA